MDRLRGKIAVVTGSTSGNGRAIALALASEGAALICSDIRKSALEGGYESDIKVDTDDLRFLTGPHGLQCLGIPPGKRSVGSDTEEVTGSNPVAPTSKTLTSGNATKPSASARPQSEEST
jgi:hypothetical protein